MKLPKEAIDEFKAICKKEFDLELTDSEATEQANDLFDLYCLVYGVQ